MQEHIHFKRRYYKPILLLAVFFIGFFVQSQSPHTEFISVAERSLSSSFGRCFLKDSKGYMWIGTADGLIRYDGFKIYRYEHNPQDETSITNNNINVIVEDAQNRLWVGTSQGLSIYDREKDHFINVDRIPANKGHLKNGYVTSIAFDRSEEHTSELQSRENLVCRLLLEKKKKIT